MLVLAVMVGGTLAAAGAAQAATVSLFAAPAAIGAGDCSTATDACTIADAVASANGQATTDSVSIILADGSYTISAPALAVTFAGPSLTLAAAPGAHPVLDGADATQLLTIAAGATVVVRGVGFSHGHSTDLGGAISNAGALTVQDATFADNTAVNGGAIHGSAGSVTAVRDSTFSRNTATGTGGGAMILFSTATVTRSAFLDNTAPTNGGAVNVQPGGDVTISRSTLSGSVTIGLGGAISNLGTLVVQGSTLVGNQAAQGSAIASGNSRATFAANIIGPQAGGVACSPANSAFADAGYNLDVDGTCISDSAPAVGSHNGTTAYDTSTYGQVLSAYLAGAPADNGGPTKTVALLNTPVPATALANPAFNAVPPSFALPAPIGGETGACATADQRGVLPAPGANCAIGAYLLQQPTVTLAPSSPAVALGAPVTWTAAFAPASTTGGTVAFDDGANGPATAQCAAQPLTAGTATCTVTYPSGGIWTATATYSGDGAQNDFAPATSGSAAVAVAALVPPAKPAPPAPPAPATPTPTPPRRAHRPPGRRR